VTADHYAILGVSPAAEDVVIGAAYRALIRHYHPDTNPDPKAQERAREITAAYTVLRDPVSRANYDAGRGVDLWDEDDEPRPPPPMRAVGLGATLLAVAGAAAVWFWPRDPAPVLQAPAPPPKVAAHETLPEPIVPLQPEHERLADLDRATAPPPPIAQPEAILDDLPTDPVPPPARAAPARPRNTAPTRKPADAAPRTRVAVPSLAPRSERVATLDRMARSYFTQSMTYAPDKKAQLQAAQDRSEAKRKACRSDSCVADAYVRQIRETSAIMEIRPGPKN
jgi:hypothetical protein